MIITDARIKELEDIARGIRRDVLLMLALAGSGHTGGSLGAVEIFVALYYEAMKHDPKNQYWEERDKLFVSEGHICPAWYAVLADRGYFPRDELWKLRKIGALLQGHPSIEIPGVEIGSGSLGQGLSIANGAAIAAKMDGMLDKMIYCILGDGESQEGQIWEAVQTSYHRNLDNVCVFFNYNDLQIDDTVEKVKKIYSVKSRFGGWKVIGKEIKLSERREGQYMDGHDFRFLLESIAAPSDGKPKLIIANTTKGKGVPYIENKVEWHGQVPTEEEAEKWIKEHLS